MPVNVGSVRPSDLALAARVRADLKSGRARRERIAAGVSGAEVARGCAPRVSPQAVFDWETRQKLPTAEHALAYGRLLAALARRAA